MAAERTEPQGIQFPVDANGKRSSARCGQKAIAAALGVMDAGAAGACLGERDWRHRYPQHVHRLVSLQAANPREVVASCQAGLDALWTTLEFVRGGTPLTLRDAMAAPASPALRSIELRGRGPSAPAPWEVPYKGRRLSGDALARRIDAWLAAGVIEASHAEALHLARTHPEWFDLSDRHLVLLGAGSEAGPLGWLARWRANIVGIDLARAPTWKKIAQRVSQGNGTLLAPVAEGLPLRGDAEHDIALSGADMLTQTPEIARWLQQLERRLDLFSIAYLDGERHVRVSLAMDAITDACCSTRSDHTRAWMATPTDVFAVPQPVADAVMRAYEDRGLLKRLAQAGIRAGSGGRSFQRQIDSLVEASDGSRWGVLDCLVIEQGPNYALAKRLQQWRAIVARSAGQVASLNVAPSTSTASVTSNPALAAGFRGAKAFDIEVFEPETTNALMAAMWVHDLRNPRSSAHPSVTLPHPLQLLVEGANHGGLWRTPYLPRSVLPFAAALGLLKRL